jgi:L-threonylcarbamoyladenylate synthase
VHTLLLSIASPGADAVGRAAGLLRSGRLVAFPTETVYGLGALGLDPQAVERIFVAKGRPHSDPLILHLADASWVQDLAGTLPDAFDRLARAFWPGPMTLVLPKSRRVPDLVTAGLDSVAVRVPAHPVALELIRQVGAPVAAPSANLFSRPSPTTAWHVLEDLDGRIDAVLDGGPTTVGVESTVLDLRGEAPRILRPGGVTREALEAALGSSVLGRGETEAREGHRSPGLLTRHYSPRAEVRLFAGAPGKALAAIREEAGRLGARAAVLAYREDLAGLAGIDARVVDLGPAARPDEAATRLYAALRELDGAGVEVIFARLLPPGGLADALNDRLTRAASGRVSRCD